MKHLMTPARATPQRDAWTFSRAELLELLQNRCYVSPHVGEWSTETTGDGGITLVRILRVVPVKDP